MYEGIQRAHQVLVEQLASFNSTWPGLVVDGRVWQVPLLNEQKTPDVLEVQEVDGQSAIALATAALAKPPAPSCACRATSACRPACYRRCWPSMRASR